MKASFKTTELKLNIDDHEYKISAQYIPGTNVDTEAHQQILDIIREKCAILNLDFNNQQHKINGLSVQSLGNIGESFNKVIIDDKQGLFEEMSLSNKILETANPPLIIDYNIGASSVQFIKCDLSGDNQISQFEA